MVVLFLLFYHIYFFFQHKITQKQTNFDSRKQKIKKNLFLSVNKLIILNSSRKNFINATCFFHALIWFGSGLSGKKAKPSTSLQINVIFFASIVQSIL